MLWLDFVNKTLFGKNIFHHQTLKFAAIGDHYALKIIRNQGFQELCR